MAAPLVFSTGAAVQAAVYDAVVAYGGRFQPYHVQISGASGSPVGRYRRRRL